MSELVALVDSSGAARTPGLPRDEAFERAQSDPELYIPIAVAVIFNGIGWVLVQKRAGGKVDAGKLDLVCGIVPAGEDPADTAVRESIEETNVEPFGCAGYTRELLLQKTTAIYLLAIATVAAEP